jgi:hypothetical protein
LLWHAANSGAEACVELLLKAGAALDAQDVHGATALWAAVYQGESNVVRMLLLAKAATELTFCEGDTALHRAACLGHTECLRALIEAGADVHRADGQGHTPLWAASYMGHAVCANLLLRAGARLEEASADGGTPLWWAAANGHLACARVLLQAGARCEVANSEGRSVLDAAKKHPDLHAWLQRQQQDPERQREPSSVDAVVDPKEAADSLAKLVRALDDLGLAGALLEEKEKARRPARPTDAERKRFDNLTREAKDLLAKLSHEYST